MWCASARPFDSAQGERDQGGPHWVCIFSPFDPPKADFQLGFRLSVSSTGGYSICDRVSGPSRGWIPAWGAGMTEGGGVGGLAV